MNNQCGYKNPDGLYAKTVRQQSKQAADALLIELIRSKPQLNHNAIAEMLGISRWLVSTTAAKHNVRRVHGPRAK